VKVQSRKELTNVAIQERQVEPGYKLDISGGVGGGEGLVRGV
jgi:hypothetical protein